MASFNRAGSNVGPLNGTVSKFVASDSVVGKVAQLSSAVCHLGVGYTLSSDLSGCDGCVCQFLVGEPDVVSELAGSHSAVLDRSSVHYVFCQLVCSHGLRHQILAVNRGRAQLQVGDCVVLEVVSLNGAVGELLPRHGSQSKVSKSNSTITNRSCGDGTGSQTRHRHGVVCDVNGVDGVFCQLGGSDLLIKNLFRGNGTRSKSDLTPTKELALSDGTVSNSAGVKKRSLELVGSDSESLDFVGGHGIVGNLGSCDGSRIEIFLTELT
mmetsp:Transcript_49308/g.96725  ORF Transcript_49308/g.96725 Transcript_49308/m.96725 type:complete len:267 (+) Transcript_49308:3682-4482(+)